MIYKSQTISNWDKLPVALDLHTVALIFDVTDATIKNWIYKGTLKGSKVGGKWFFDKDYIRNYIAGECKAVMQ
ncbi:MAG: helix-turn-helix domain-containing protein [Eubacterium sp.]|nr:helix-turn-helix domain-containing protein [Eubacterium sp.]